MIGQGACYEIFTPNLHELETISENTSPYEWGAQMG